MSTETSDRDKCTIDRREHEWYIALEADLEAAADRLAKTHPIGQIKAIGLREVALAVEEVCDELDRLRADRDRLAAERDALIAAWPRGGDDDGPVVTEYPPGVFLLWTVNRTVWFGPGGPGPFPTKAAAVRAAIGAGEQATEQTEG